MNIKVYEQNDSFLIAVNDIQDCKAVLLKVLTAMSDTSPTSLMNLEKIDTANIVPSLDGVTPICSEVDLTEAIRYISSPIRRTAAEALAKTYGYANLKTMLERKNPAEVNDLYRILVIKSI